MAGLATLMSLTTILAFSSMPAYVSAQIDLKSDAILSEKLFAGARAQEVLAVQILLDRSDHSPGVIDGMMGKNTARAIRAFQGARGLPIDGKISGKLMEKLRKDHAGDLLRNYVITEEDVSGPFVDVPQKMEAQARLDSLSFESPAEALAEKFHMARSLLVALNPGADFSTAGSSIVVVIAGINKISSPVARIEVDKSRSELRAYGRDGVLVASYPATVGSSTFPSPSGSMEVKAIAPQPTYHFDPQGRGWGPDKRLTIAAGPNNPVGGTWIDLSEDGYGIHGTPEPKLIGKTSSHGCVRLTNWDAEELALAVSVGTKVQFV